MSSALSQSSGAADTRRRPNSTLRDSDSRSSRLGMPCRVGRNLQAVEECVQAVAQVFRPLKLEIRDPAQRMQVLEQSGLDGSVLPDEEQDRGARTAEDVISQFEGRALAERNADVDEDICLVEQAKSVLPEPAR